MTLQLSGSNLNLTRSLRFVSNLEQAMKAPRRNSTLLLTSALDVGGWLTSCPGRCNTGRLGTHCTGGWMGIAAGVGRCGKSSPPSGFEPFSP
jgi:hypothetical protein